MVRKNIEQLAEDVRRRKLTVRPAQEADAVSDRLAALHASAGTWADRADDGAAYVDGLRSDFNDRLCALGLDEQL
jgi:hypothetical protein